MCGVRVGGESGRERTEEGNGEKRRRDEGMQCIGSERRRVHRIKQENSD